MASFRQVGKIYRNTTSRQQKDAEMNQLRILFKCMMDAYTLKRQNCPVRRQTDIRSKSTKRRVRSKESKFKLPILRRKEVHLIVLVPELF